MVQKYYQFIIKNKDAESFPNLHALSLLGCPKIADEGICAIASAHPNMQKYELEGCGGITDTSVKKIAQSDRNLKYFNLIWCLPVSDVSICKIAQPCPKLKSLQLQSCNITDVSIQRISYSCHNLRDLKHSISYEVINALKTEILISITLVGIQIRIGSQIYSRYSSE